MLDEKSLVVTYRHWRGEPRGSVKTAQAAPGKFGDCIDCNQCVAVCPTGIDIREGPQIGCITCALCIDACDRVMTQTGKPRGLIDYLTEDDATAEKAGRPPRSILRSLFHVRTIVYFSIWGAIGLAMLFALGARERMTISALQDRNPLFVRLSDGAIRNAFTIKLRNMQDRPRRMEISVSGLPGAKIWTEGNTRETAPPTVIVTVPADSVSRSRIFVASNVAGEQRQSFEFTLRALDAEGGQQRQPVHFERP
jgi:cytochrome c oxidase accessory protein FixG